MTHGEVAALAVAWLGFGLIISGLLRQEGEGRRNALIVGLTWPVHVLVAMSVGIVWYAWVWLRLVFRGDK